MTFYLQRCMAACQFQSQLVGGFKMDTYMVPCEPDPQQFDMCHLCSKLMMDLDGHKKVQTLFHDMEIIGQYASSNQKTLSISITTCALNLEVANRRTQKLCKYTK